MFCLNMAGHVVSPWSLMTTRDTSPAVKALRINLSYHHWRQEVWKFLLRFTKLMFYLFDAMSLWIVGIKAVLGAIKLGANSTKETSAWKMFGLDMTSNVMFVGWRVSTFRAEPSAGHNFSRNHLIHISSWKRLDYTQKVQTLLSMVPWNMRCQSVSAGAKLWAVTAIKSRGLNVFSLNMFVEISLRLWHVSTLDTSPHSETIFIDILGHQGRDCLWKELNGNTEKWLKAL